MKSIFVLIAVVLAGVFVAADSYASCVSLSWTASGDDGYEGRAALYDLRYSLSPITPTNVNSLPSYKWSPEPLHSGSTEYVDISGLFPASRYYFVLRVADESNNWSDWSNVVTKVAPPDVCVDRVGNVNCDPEDLVDLSDLLSLVNTLFLGGPPICCRSEANIDGDPYNVVDLSDVLVMANTLFVTSGTFPRCP